MRGVQRPPYHAQRREPRDAQHCALCTPRLEAGMNTVRAGGRHSAHTETRPRHNSSSKSTSRAPALCRPTRILHVHRSIAAQAKQPPSSLVLHMSRQGRQPARDADGYSVDRVWHRAPRCARGGLQPSPGRVPQPACVSMSMRSPFAFAVISALAYGSCRPRASEVTRPAARPPRVARPTRRTYSTPSRGKSNRTT